MSRKITISVPVDMVVRSRDLQLITIIEEFAARAGSGDKPVNISKSELADRYGACISTVKRAIDSAEQEGYLVTSENFLQNGARIENAYQVTEQGRRVIAAARQAGYIVDDRVDVAA